MLQAGKHDVNYIKMVLNSWSFIFKQMLTRHNPGLPHGFSGGLTKLNDWLFLLR